MAFYMILYKIAGDELIKSFLTAGIYFRLVFIEYENNNRIMNEKIRNEDGSSSDMTQAE